MSKKKLTKTMSIDDFNNGYWYASDIKKFAKDIGIGSASKLRKDELEVLIKHFLKTGKVKKLGRTKLGKTSIKDLEKGLTMKLQIINYVGNKETKDFIIREALKLAPNLKKKSGARNRLNRWREEQIEKGKKITYGDLVKQFIDLNGTEAKFEQIPSGRYINFITDYLASERRSTRAQAVRAWEELKMLDIPKTYVAWKKYKK